MRRRGQTARKASRAAKVKAAVAENAATGPNRAYTPATNTGPSARDKHPAPVSTPIHTPWTFAITDERDSTLIHEYSRDISTTGSNKSDSNNFYTW